MSISTKLKEYLDSEGVDYAPHFHPTAYTAQEIAAITHIPGRELAKTVIVKADGKLLMAVLSANDRVDLETLQNELNPQSCAWSRRMRAPRLHPWLYNVKDTAKGGLL